MSGDTTDGNGPFKILAALDQRLTEAARVAIPGAQDPHGTAPGSAAGGLLPQLVAKATAEGDAVVWLLLTAVFGAYPTSEQVRSLARRLTFTSSDVAASQMLAAALRDPRRGRLDLPITIVEGGVVVDVDFCARYETHTGIHRVVRETLPRWRATHDLVAAAWIEEYTALRTLSPAEGARVFEFGRRPTTGRGADPAAVTESLLVPWNSVVVLPDVPGGRASAPLTSLARHSGNRLAIVGYDMIPVTSAETRPSTDTVAFAEYLTVVKYAHRVAGISSSATAEYAGFARSISAQGLVGPLVQQVTLADEAPSPVRRTPRDHRDRPVLLCVGSHEPHKNQRAALHAAERLWHEGVDLEVRIVGGRGWDHDVLEPTVERLAAEGHAITALGRVSDELLIEEMESADVVFFASLHEGFGLPVAEALACGTPVITSNYGSQQEIAAKGGALVVDPRDDDDVTAAVRLLITDPVARARLRDEAARRPVRTWDDYAEDLWAFVTGPLAAS